MKKDMLLKNTFYSHSLCVWLCLSLSSNQSSIFGDKAKDHFVLEK